MKCITGVTKLALNWHEIRLFGDHNVREPPLTSGHRVKAVDGTGAVKFCLVEEVPVARTLTPERRALKLDALQLRRELGWSERQIAKALGVPQQTVNLWLKAGKESLAIPGQLPQATRNSKGHLTNNSGPLALGKVHVMDATQGLRLLAPRSVDLIFADPPYNIGVNYGTGLNDQRPHDNYLLWCDQWFEACARALRPGGSIYLMHYPEVCAEWFRRLDRWFTFRHWITWHFATNIGQSPTDWTRSQRAILYYTKGAGFTFNGLADPQPYRNPTDRRVRQLIEDGRPGVTPYDTWEYNLVKNVSDEKTAWANQVPLALVERIVKVSSCEGGLVCDPFMGSGTTAEAAARNNRRWVGFDTNHQSVVETERRLGALRI